MCFCKGSYSVFWAVLGIFISIPVTAQWSNDPKVNTPVCTAFGDQYLSTDKGNRYGVYASVPDGGGGVIITWNDERSGNTDVYAQRMDAYGVAQWAAGGVALCTAGGDQKQATAVSDGSGGAIFTWNDRRLEDSNIYAQRVNASGAVQWMTDGVPICTVAANQIHPTIISDGSGGAIIAWHDWRSGNKDVYVQRVDASGAVQWTADGVAICTATKHQEFTAIVSDGSGGAIITWEDKRSGDTDIYAQRVDASGAVQWMSDGVGISTLDDDQEYPTIASDGSGGAIIAWQDERSGDKDIYVQRVDASGAIQWTAEGVAVCTAANSQSASVIISDGGGGALITWEDSRSGNTDIYAQRVDAVGAVQWASDGVAICTFHNDQGQPTIVSDLSGGVIITWEDSRSGEKDIYAQRLDPFGVVQWTDDGVAVSTAANDQELTTIVTDGSDGVIITWGDERSEDSDIYTQQVCPNGLLGCGDRGDVNGDGNVDVLDVIATIRHILDIELLEGDAFWRADCNNDGEIDVQDALGIVNVILGIGTCEP